MPYGFDGGFTMTIPAGGSRSAGFDLVRHPGEARATARQSGQRRRQNVISTIAEITFFGRDQAGNEVSVTGSITVNFADFGDPS